MGLRDIPAGVAGGDAGLRGERHLVRGEGAEADQVPNRGKRQANGKPVSRRRNRYFQTQSKEGRIENLVNLEGGRWYFIYFLDILGSLEGGNGPGE